MKSVLADKNTANSDDVEALTSLVLNVLSSEPKFLTTQQLVDAAGAYDRRAFADLLHTLSVTDGFIFRIPAQSGEKRLFCYASDKEKLPEVGFSFDVLEGGKDFRTFTVIKEVEIPAAAPIIKPSRVADTPMATAKVSTPDLDAEDEFVEPTSNLLSSLLFSGTTPPPIKHRKTSKELVEVVAAAPTPQEKQKLEHFLPAAPLPEVIKNAAPKTPAVKRLSATHPLVETPHTPSLELHTMNTTAKLSELSHAVLKVIPEVAAGPFDTSIIYDSLKASHDIALGRMLAPLTYRTLLSKIVVSIRELVAAKLIEKFDEEETKGLHLGRGAAYARFGKKEATLTAAKNKVVAKAVPVAPKIDASEKSKLAAALAEKNKTDEAAAKKTRATIEKATTSTKPAALEAQVKPVADLHSVKAESAGNLTEDLNAAKPVSFKEALRNSLVRVMDERQKTIQLLLDNNVSILQPHNDACRALLEHYDDVINETLMLIKVVK